MTWLVELIVVRLMLGLQNRILLDVVGVFVGLGGETVLGRGGCCDRRSRSYPGSSSPAELN